MPICRRRESFFEDGNNLGWYNMKKPTRKPENGEEFILGEVFNILDGPYCDECTKILVSTKVVNEEK